MHAPTDKDLLEAQNFLLDEAVPPGLIMTDQLAEFVCKVRKDGAKEVLESLLHFADNKANEAGKVAIRMAVTELLLKLT